MSASDSPRGFYHIGTPGEPGFVLEAIEYRAGFGIKKKPLGFKFTVAAVWPHGHIT